ncbi:MAG: aminopeptidase [Candidatus Thorarchaeota archaeon]|jgi:leucyl aminopeptidase (aminopeptidase T)
MDPKTAAANALDAVLEARSGESILVVTDDVRKDVGQAFADGAIELGLWTRLVVLDTSNEFRTEVPAHLSEMINAPNPPDIFINTLRGPAKETPFRIKVIKLETRKGTSRLGHCPGITMDMLTEGALSLTKEEHLKMQSDARSLLAILQGAVKVHVKAPAGSDFTFDVTGRTWFSDTYIDWKEMKWMNLPTGEVIIGPIETSMQGTLVCDLAVGGIGPLEKPIRIDVKDGRVQSVQSEDANAQSIVEETQETDEMAKHIGEFAFGLNPKARLVEEFLESEKVGSAIHVAFGNNMDYPGVAGNNSATHQDFLVDKPTVSVNYGDGRERLVMKDGTLEL